MAKFPWDPSAIQRAVDEFRRFNEELRKAGDSSRQVQRAIESLRLPQIDYAYLASADRLVAQVVQERREMEAAIRSWSTNLAAHQTVWEALSRTAVFEVPRWLRDLDSTAILKAATVASASWESLLSAPGFAQIAVDTQRLQSLAASHREAIRAATGSIERRLTMEEYMRAGFEVAIGASSRPKTPEEVFKLRLAMFYFLCGLLLNLNSHYQTARQSSEADERRVVEREHAQSIASLTEAVRQLKEDMSLRSAEPDLRLRVTRPGILREGPSSHTPRVARLKTGQRLRLISEYDRWLLVEVLASDGSKTGILGWVYQRVVQTDSPR